MPSKVVGYREPESQVSIALYLASCIAPVGNVLYGFHLGQINVYVQVYFSIYCKTLKPEIAFERSPSVAYLEGRIYYKFGR